MDLQEFYRELSQEINGGVLRLRPELGGGTMFYLLCAVGIAQIEECTMAMQAEQVMIDGKCQIYRWNLAEPFAVRLLCREEGAEIVYQASFWSDFQGKLSEFFAGVAPTLVTQENGTVSGFPLIADLWVSSPVISYDSHDYMRILPLKFSAVTRKPEGDLWKQYDYLLAGMDRIEGDLNKDGVFEFLVPLAKAVTGIFPSAGLALILRNGAKYREDIRNPVISQAGLKLSLMLPQLNEVDFTVPLFSQSEYLNLHTYFPNGLGITDIVNLLSELFHTGGSIAALSLPADTPLNQFKLYQIDLLTKKQGLSHGSAGNLSGDLSLAMKYLMMEFALAKPWQLPVPYVTLERLGVGFQITFGNGKDMGNLLTASAGGTLSVTLGNYKLTMELDMELPELTFTAQAKLKKRENTDQPGIAELADTFGVTLPGQWQQENHLLGQVTVYGSGSSRSFAIEAGVYDILSFSIGDLAFSLQSVEAGAQVTTSHFSFYVQGMMEFGEGADAFSIYLKAAYENPGWVFEGGLYQGKINIGQVLSKMFKMDAPAEDVFSLSLSELSVFYATEEKKFLLTAAFAADWRIHLLGKDFKLGGRIQICKEEEQKTDASALAYISLGGFKLLAQVDHVQKEQDRSFLFRLEYDKLYLQAAWFHRNGDEILSVSLGGMTLGGLVEALVNMINPNKRYTLSSPWNLLNKIELSKFLFELNVTKNQAYFLYRAQLDIAGLMYIENVGIRYDMEHNKLFFVLTGRLLGVTYGEDNPVTWDAVDGQPPADSADNEKKFELSYLGMGRHLKNDKAAGADSIEEAVGALREQLNPSSISQKITYDEGTNWLFGADFTINGMLNVKVVLNDPVLYGLLVTVNAKQGSALEFLDGFGIELLCKKVSSDVYMFRGELLVPKKYRTINLGAVSLTLGTIRVEIYTNGGFYVDLGFPHQMDFSRSFVLEWGIFTGRGGIYFGIMKNVSVPNLPVVTNGNFSPIVTLGIGLSVGLGRSFDLGIVKGGVSLEAFGVFEGVLAIFHEKDTGKESTYYYVKAVAGIVGRLYLSVDFKIITIQASAEIKASAALTMQAYKASVVELELALKLEASIKILFIKIQFSFSFQQKVTFTIGKDERAPWTSEGEMLLQNRRSGFGIRGLRAASLTAEQIRVSMVPLFYLANPSIEADTPKQYGTAFLMMMDLGTLTQWTGLLADWVLSHFPEDTVTARHAEALSLELADTMTYAVLEEFLKQNVMVSYDIHWIEEEQRLQESMEEEPARFVFPMLPSLTVSFGKEGEEKQVQYWKAQPVEQHYFDLLTDYFRQLNPDPSQTEEKMVLSGEENAGEEPLPIAKAFFQDYFRMFLREVIGRLQRAFGQVDTETGVCSAAQNYGLSVEEILRQNTTLIFTPGRELIFPAFRYMIRESDTLDSICNRFSCDRTALWQSVRQETFLVQTGSMIAYGEGVFHNELSQFTLEQAAAFLFVRFFEELVPADMFYAGDIVRLNAEKYEELDINWRETEPGGHVLTLPEDAGEYRTMRGDTPERIGRYLSLLNKDKNGFEEWQNFYKDIRERNEGQAARLPSTIKFYAARVLVREDIDLAALADRLYPDCKEEEFPDIRLYSAPVLKLNTPVMIPDALWRIPDEGEVTVEMLLNTLSCTVEELGQAVLEDAVFCERQKLRLAGVERIDKAELRRFAMQEADIIGGMLSRFLLQGLTVPAPDPEEAGEKDTLPLFQVLQQMFLLEDGEDDRKLRVVSDEPDCAWVETDEKQKVMSWKQIKERLPNGDFSVRPSAFAKMEDFVLSGQYFTLTDGAAVYREKESLWMYSFSEALQETLKQGQAAPILLNENGEKQKLAWGCLIPLTIGVCGEEGIFALYGADAKTRLVLHQLLFLSDASFRIMYQASGISKGGQSFWECDWSVENSFLARTNLSVETHMGFLRAAAGAEETKHVVELDRKADFLRLMWDCSTVGGGGYYLQLKTGNGQTLPGDIFDEQGVGTIWLLAQNEDYAVLSGCVNCCILPKIPDKDSTMTLVTQDTLQEKHQPVFPAGCVGLCTEMPAPSGEKSLPEEEEYMRSLFQITGFQVMEGVDYQESHISTPLLPEERNHMWHYQTVVPMYRYVSKPADRENPYLAVGKQGKIRLQLRDVLGNMLHLGDTQITPYYNDVLIGIGQYPAAKTSYALTGSADAPVLRLVFHTVFPDAPSDETVVCQRRAAMQLACEDIQVTVSSPVNDEVFSLSVMKENDRSYLELLREYVNSLADVMEGNHEGTVPDAWFMDFPLHMEEYPLPAKIFELKTLITVSRAEALAPEPAAQKTVSEVFPSAFWGEETQKMQEKNLLVFCRSAQNALKGLYFAQRARGDSVLYGISYGENGFIKELDVQLMTYRAKTMSGEDKTVQAPEYYALSPLYQGFISRMAAVRMLSEELVLSDTFSSVSFSDVDMELWANQFLEDIEALLLSGPVKKACLKCRKILDALVKAKERLAMAIASQLLSLRQEGTKAEPELTEMVTDRLKRSLKDGYSTDVAAVCKLCFRTQEDERCRLTVAAQNAMEGTQTTVGKAESKKEELALFFTNTFTGKSIPFKTDILFTELEYDIEKEIDGYESSKWLRFVEPVRSMRTSGGSGYDLESEIDLPNPLKICPQPPVLQGHSCEMDIVSEEEDVLYQSLTDAKIGWDYSLALKYLYREQDTFLIRVEFESIAALQGYALRRDLFDVLAEYSLTRDRLWKAVSEEAGDSIKYLNAYESFTNIVCEAAEVWESWVLDNQDKNEVEKETAEADVSDADKMTELVYSCTAEGVQTAEGIRFRITHTKEGLDFIERLGLEGREPYMEAVASDFKTGETKLRFVMRQLPLFACAQAKPSVKIIRNRNLLTGKDKNLNLVVRKDFIYQTQEVSLPVLPVTGEYTKEYRIAAIPAHTITKETISQAVSALYSALQLDHGNLMAELSAAYYYGLDIGRDRPRVLLPITLIPCTDTLDAEGSPASFIENLTDNLYQWYQERQPVTNACGFLFDVKIYLGNSQKLLLHFSDLSVSLDLIKLH